MKVITPYDYNQAAKVLGCEVAAIKAVTLVEAPRGAYDAQDRITLLFEPYIFYKELRKDGVNTAPLLANPALNDIISSFWNPKLYGTYNAQYGKLERAKKINVEVALMSASYGKFQIMGFNHELCGFATPADFVNELTNGGEPAHLAAFIKYLKSTGLDDELRNKDWAGFASGYNGPSYRKNMYDTKLKKAYLQFAK
jgi:N-acetylmuramidase